MTEFVSDLTDCVCWKLSNALDVPKKPNWKTLISKMPHKTFDEKSINKFHMAILKPYGSPTLELLTYMGKKKMKTSDLIEWLKDIGRFPDLVELLIKGDSFLENALPVIMDQPQKNVTFNVGESGVVGFTLSGDTSGVKYQWFKEANALPHQTLHELNIVEATMGEAGYYVCRISNNSTYVYTAWCHIEVTEVQIDDLWNILNQPLITMHPRSTLLCTGETLYLSADAMGQPTPTLQWYFNDQLLIGECSQETVIEDLNPDLHDGFYKISATNQSGTVFSLPAQVIINKTKPDITASSDSTGYECKQHSRSTTNKTMYDNMLHQDTANPRGPDYFPSTATVSSIMSINSPSDKVALLIGNQNYIHKSNLGELVHPTNDTLELSAALMSIDFKVVSLVNLDLASMKQALQFFYGIIESGSYALFYFAGHGFEIEGKNYLMPVDATDSYEPGENLPLSDVLIAVTNKRAQLSVLLIDSCRTNPMLCREDPIQKLLPHFSSRTDEPCHPIRRKNVIIGYGCCSRSRVLESPLMKNGYFAHFLAEYITRDIKIQDVLYEVSKAINRERIVDPATGRIQVVYRHNTIVDDLKLTDVPNQSLPLSNQALLWQKAHIAPNSPITIFTNDHVTVKLAFTAECSNSLLIQGEIIKKTVVSNCTLDFVMSKNIGGSAVEILTQKEKDISNTCVRISNLERLLGDIEIHIIIRFNDIENFASYTIKEKPLYAKIIEAMKEISI